MVLCIVRREELRSNIIKLDQAVKDLEQGIENCQSYIEAFRGSGQQRFDDLVDDDGLSEGLKGFYEGSKKQTIYAQERLSRFVVEFILEWKKYK